jgi:hypothetical protein
MQMARFFQRMAALLRRLFGRPPIPLPTPQQENSSRKVSLIIIDPLVPGQGGRRLSEVLGWRDSDRLMAELIEDLREVSHGYARFTIAERIVVDDFAVKADGFRYDPDKFVHAWSHREGFHQPDAVDYHNLLVEHNLIEKINAGTIDEVWTVSYPYAGFYESRMAGPGAFWCNAPPLEQTGHARRRFVIMAYNYERGVGEALESFGHRAESIMAHVFHGKRGEQDLWNRFTRHEKTHPGQAEVGTVHFAPNSQRDYDWGNATPVATRCHTWGSFPNLAGEAAVMTCQEWGGGDIRSHHRWWFRLIPHAQGETNGISNNWWEYIVDPNRVE